MKHNFIIYKYIIYCTIIKTPFLNSLISTDLFLIPLEIKTIKQSIMQNFQCCYERTNQERRFFLMKMEEM